MTERITCSNDDCGEPFKINARNPADDLECPACRMGDRDRRDPPDMGCPVCEEEPLSRRELRSLEGQQIEGQVCVLASGEVLVHPEEGDE